MKTLLKVISAFVLCAVLGATYIQAQTGHYGVRTPAKKTTAGSGIHADSTVTYYTGDPAVQPISDAHIYLYEPGHSRDQAQSLIDCGQVGNGIVFEDSNGNCYVKSQADGSYDLDNSDTDYYNNCQDDTSLVYLIAVGGQRVYNPSYPNPDPALENPEIANIAVSPVDCADLTGETYFNVSDLSTVATAYTVATFANEYPFPTDGFSTKTSISGGLAALKTAFQAANNLVSTITNTNAAAFGSGVNATAQETMNTVADIMVACQVTTGSTSSGTPCGELYGYATAPNLQYSGTTSLTPTDLWLTPLFMVENPASNGYMASEWSLIADPSNPVWGPVYTSSSSLPATWDIETVAQNPSTGAFYEPSTSLGGPAIYSFAPPGAGQLSEYVSQVKGSTLYVNGVNLTGSCGSSPILVVNGLVASISYSSSTELVATVPSLYPWNSSNNYPGYVGVYSCGYASNFLPFIVTKS